MAAVPVAALAVTASAFSARPPDAEKVSVCHHTGSGSFVEISIPLRAFGAHEAHGDVLVGDYGYCP